MKTLYNAETVFLTCIMHKQQCRRTWKKNEFKLKRGKNDEIYNSSFFSSPASSLSSSSSSFSSSSASSSPSGTSTSLMGASGSTPSSFDMSRYTRFTRADGSAIS